MSRQVVDVCHLTEHWIGWISEIQSLDAPLSVKSCTKEATCKTKKVEVVPKQQSLESWFFATLEVIQSGLNIESLVS